MKYRVYFNYTSCVDMLIEADNEDELCEKISDARNNITEEDIMDSIQENCVDYEEAN